MVEEERTRNIHDDLDDLLDAVNNDKATDLDNLEGHPNGPSQQPNGDSTQQQKKKKKKKNKKKNK